MKRHPALIQLSREHHSALVLAKRAKRMSEGTPDARNTFAAEVGRIFALDLEPHFQLEEKMLLPALMAAGEREAAEQTLTEHTELRALVYQPGINHQGTLRRFGDALAEHVRFEEQELFPRAEAVLEEETLDLIRQGMDGTTSSSSNQ